MEGINYPSEKNVWKKKIDKNNLTTALNEWHVKNEEKTYHAYVSKHNSKCEKHVVMLSKDTGILEFHQYHKPDESFANIYADFQSFIKMKKRDGFKNNLKTSSTTKIGEQFPCGYSISTIWAFNGMKIKHGVCRGKNVMKKSVA